MEKLNKLKDYLSNLKKVVIAYSGGVDSTFLMKVAVDTLGVEAVQGINIVSPLQTEGELIELKSIAEQRNWKLKHLKINQLEDEVICANSEQRCYFCKLKLFTQIGTMAEELGYEHILDGTNFDDILDYRPGLKAIKELGVKSPLMELEFTKAEIRKCSKELDLETWEKPSAACLASRIPYGTKLNSEVLKKIENCEDYLNNLGYLGFRVRYHGDVARIELDPKDFLRFIEEDRLKVYSFFREVGFLYITLDIKGYESGNMNRTVEGVK